MSEASLKICGLVYRVVYATGEEVPELATSEGYTMTGTNTIYVRSSLPLCRKRDTLMHEVMHAFFEASGVGSLLSDSVRGNYDKFEETLIRLLVPSVLRLVDENGRALLHVPKTVKPLVKTKPTKKGKR